ncbi:MAG: hypothetical protein KGL41_00450 [Actinomycetales bacterium]|nr:hypothetical protein [Actinomycetales bacterium]
MSEQLATTKGKLAALVKSMAAVSRKAQPTAATPQTQSLAQSSYPESTIVYREVSSPAPATKTATNYNQPPVATPKPARIKRERTPVSVQQWLIIGAAFLVFVAASVFVATNKGISQGGYLGITAGVSLLTGFAAFRGRKFSVLLSNFLAAFSSAMLMMSMLVIGDMLFGYPWDASTQTWWSVTLAVVAVHSAVLAKFSSNFGWKAIAPLSFTFSGLLFTYGTVGTWLRGVTNGYPWQLLTLSFTIIGLLYLLRFLKGIPHRISDVEADADYEKDLERREISALDKYAQFATVLLAVFGAALTATQTLSLFNAPIDPFASSALGALWIFGAQTIDRWGAPLSTAGVVDQRIRKLAWILGYVNVGLGVVSFASSNLNLWFGALLSLAVIAAILASPSLKWLKSEQLGINFGVWSSVAAWSVWTFSASLPNHLDDWVLSLAAFALVLSVILVLADLVAKKRRDALIPMIVNGFGLIVFPFGILNRPDLSPVQLILFLLLIFASGLGFTLVSRFVGAKVGHRDSPVFAGIQLAAQAIGGVTLLSTSVDQGFTTVLVSLFLIALTFAARMVARTLHSESGSAAASSLRLQSHLTQGLLVIELVKLSPSVGDASASHQFIWVALAAAMANYLIALIEKNQLFTFFGLSAASLIGLALWDELPDLLTEGQKFALVVVVMSALAWLHARFIASRFEQRAASSLALAFLPIFGTGFIAGLLHMTAYSKFDSSDHLVLQLTITAIVAALLISRRRSRGQNTGKTPSLLAQLLPIGYSIFGLIWSDSRNWSGIIAGLTLGLAAFVVNRAAERLVAILGVYAGLLFSAIGLGSRTNEWLATTPSLADLAGAPEAYSIWFALAVVLATSLSGKQLGPVKRYLLADLPIAITALVSLFYSVTANASSDANFMRELISLAALAALTYWRTISVKTRVWLAGSYLFGLLSAYQLVRVLVHFERLDSQVIEWYSLAVAAALIGSAWISGDLLGDLKRFAKLDLPLVSAAGISLGYAASTNPDSDINYVRALIALLAITALAYWRTHFLKKLFALVCAYLFGALAAIQAVRLVDHFAQVNLELSELYAVALSLSIFGASSVSGDLLGRAKRTMTFDVPILFGLTVSMSHALLNDPTQGAQLLRALIDSSLFAALGIWRAVTDKSLIWLGLAYAGSIGFALSVGRELELAIRPSEPTPELYSVLLAGAAAALNPVLRRLRSSDSTLFSWGLPLGALVIPSALATSATSDLGLQQLTTTEVTRTVVTLLVSLGLFVIGVRRGNLGQTTVGVIGLGLVAWIRTGSAQGTAQIEFRSIVIAFVLFLGLAALRKYAHTGGNSLLYVGLPTAVALLPALYNSLAALAQPTLSVVDWWRFAILLIASLALLIVGSLREQAGMFFPGLIGVLSTALPYGFKGVANQSWFLWVVLLLVAAIMVWIAVRLEQMRKIGKSSINWIRELK